ncbi:hypothetical protein O1613_02475 [Proteus mirabilis]|jgi:hypothetical protein|uniref:Uncharacterized protein n=1 Tax=Proteus hauseri ATCC 700826 TaxID=1354271 RepID=A0AAJ3HU30_PROHU|nr:MULTISPECIES: hypothetical protein [Proteus]MCH4255539.1 hypothetical protein [Proteus vulgaris]MCZ4594659.1 hypothetical protein [Proteus mirabilis]MCZ4595048.1 hypothetical protein [Proteus mirabilis]OAT48888.1 hypothetical protein M997_0810 [Proteus hauseri ATCC 700826]
MTSFRRLGVFEREAKAPTLNVKQLALLLCGLYPELRVDEIPEERKEDYDIYYRQIKKWFNSSGLFSGSVAVEQDADYMFALAYELIDDEITPEPIKERCLLAVTQIASQQKGKDILKRLGGADLVSTGVELSKNKRGLHRKEDEEVNTYKLLGLTITLLANKVGGSFYDGNKITVSSIRNAIMKLSEDINLSKKGLSRATLDKKIQEALAILKYEKDE